MQPFAVQSQNTSVKHQQEAAWYVEAPHSFVNIFMIVHQVVDMVQ